MTFKRAKEICSTYSVRPAAGLYNRLTLAGFETCPAAGMIRLLLYNPKSHDQSLSCRSMLKAYVECVSYLVPLNSSYALYSVQTSEFWTCRIL
jgi:hypothetical protein